VTRALALGITIAAAAWAQDGSNVAVVVNTASPLSKRIADYYVHKRHIPLDNVCRIDAPTPESISYADYVRTIEAPVGECLRSRKLTGQIWFIALTQGVPLRIQAGRGKGPSSSAASVDSELTLLYSKLAGRTFALEGGVNNPYYRSRDEPLNHARHPIYLVTRLAGYTFDDVRAMVDRSVAAVNRGKAVIDLRGDNSTPGNEWLRNTARRIRPERLLLEETAMPVYAASNVIAFASWGSNDPDRKDRWTRMKFLPGAIVTEFVSTNARTQQEPPKSWNLSTWKAADESKWFAGAPQSMSLDAIREGASGASGHVDEPYLTGCPRPDFVIPNYLAGRTLAEAFYSGIPSLSWMNVVFGDPLCRLR
jgi:uncharacterized protein (TIGR03790 family)